MDENLEHERVLPAVTLLHVAGEQRLKAGRLQRRFVVPDDSERRPAFRGDIQQPGQPAFDPLTLGELEPEVLRVGHLDTLSEGHDELVVLARGVCEDVRTGIAREQRVIPTPLDIRVLRRALRARQSIAARNRTDLPAIHVLLRLSR